MRASWQGFGRLLRHVLAWREVTVFCSLRQSMFGDDDDEADQASVSSWLSRQRVSMPWRNGDCGQELAISSRLSRAGSRGGRLGHHLSPDLLYL